MTTRINSPSAFPARLSLPRGSAGFSLFELVVFIIAVAIIYAYAANRFADFPGQAERANFLAVTTQLNSAINVEMVYGFGAGRLRSPELLEGANPMDLMLDPPRNYLGAFTAVDASRLERRSWYFDRRRGELVYLVNDTTDVYLLQDGRRVPTDEIRFAIVADYGLYDTVSGLPLNVVERDGRQVPEAQQERRFNGVVMRPVTPYQWRGLDREAMLTEALASG